MSEDGQWVDLPDQEEQGGHWVDMPDEAPVNDPELQEALTGTGRYAGKLLDPKGHITPNKWNGRDSRTREEILQAEMGNNPPQPAPQPVDAGGQWVDVPDEQPTPQPQTTEKPDVPNPNLLQVIEQGLASGVGAAGHTLGVLGGGLAGLVSQDAGDAVFKAADEFKDKANSYILSPEQQAKETLGQKVVGGIASAAPLLLTGAVAGPVAGIATMATQAGIEGTTEKIKAGVDLKRSVAAGLVEAAAAGTAGAVPGLGKTLGKTMLLGAGTNVITGMAADAIIQPMFPDRVDIQKQHDPLDLEKRAVEAGTGAAIGGVFHGIHLAGEKAAEKRIAEMSERLSTDILTGLDKLLPEDYARYKPNPGETHAQALISLLKDSESTPLVWNEAEQRHEFASGTPTTVDKIVNLIAGDKEVRPDQRQLADAYSRLVQYLGLHNVEVSVPEFSSSLGSYWFGKDKIDIAESDPYASQHIAGPASMAAHQEAVHTILHEVTHAITNSAIRLYSELKPGDPRLADPVIKNIVDKVSKFDDVYHLAMEKWLIKEGHLKAKIDGSNYDKNTIRTLADQHIKNYDFERTYGFSDLDEFASELFTGRRFVQELQELKLTKAEVAKFANNAPSKIKNMFDLVKRSLKNLLGLSDGNTVHDVAMDHLFGIVGDLKPQNRAYTLDRDANNKPKLQPTLDQHIGEQQTHIGELASRKMDFEDSATPETKAIAYKMANIMREAHTKDELAFRLMAMSRNTVWRDWVRTKIDSLWDHSANIIEAAGSSDIKNMPEQMRKFVEDDRGIDEFMNDEFSNYITNGIVHSKLKNKDDLEDTGRRLFSPALLSVMKGGEGAKVMRWLYSKAATFKSMSEALYDRAKEHMEGYDNLKRKEQLGLIDIIAAFDSTRGRQQLIGLGEQWIPDSLLRSNGMNDAQVEAYKGMTRGLDMLHSMINQARIKQGMEPIPKIPGYMPHVWDGAYKVLVKLTTANTQREVIVMVKGFNWRQQAEKFVADLESGKYDNPRQGMLRPQYDENGMGWRVRKHEDIKEGLMAGIQEHLDAYNNFAMLDPDTIAHLEKIERDNMRGITKHMLERSGVSGYRGEFGSKKSFLEQIRVGSPSNTKLINLFDNYAKSVTEYYRNTLFVDEVASRLTNVYPVDQNGKTTYFTLFENTKELSKHMGEFSYAFTGENINEFKVIDDYFQKMSMKIGADPLAYRHMVREVRNLLSLVKLRLNPGNYAANFFQPIHTLGLLHMFNETLRGSGLTVASPSISFAKALKQRFTPDKDMNAAIEWALDNGHLKAQLTNEIKAEALGRASVDKWTGGRVNTAIESSSRMTSFMIAYEHMRSIYPDNPMKAREAAKAIMEMTMVNYDHMSRPLMYQNFGVAGEAISPFAVFRNGYVGNMMLMFDLIRRNPLMIQSYKPFIIQQMVFMASAGVIGMIGASEYDLMAKQLNDWFPETFNLPTLTEMMLKAGAPDWLTFGALSTATKGLPGAENGVYIGSSMNAVGVDDTFTAALLPFVQALASASGLTVEAAMAALTGQSVVPDAGAMYKAGRQILPGALQYYLDKKFMKAGTDVVPKSSDLYSGGYKRSTEDWDTLFWWGKRGLPESKETTINRVNAQNAQQQKLGTKKLVNAAVNHILDAGPGVSQLAPKQAKARAIQLNSEDPEFGDKFDEMVQNAIEDRLISQRTKDYMTETPASKKAQDERRKMMGWGK